MHPFIERGRLRREREAAFPWKGGARLMPCWEQSMKFAAKASVRRPAVPSPCPLGNGRPHGRCAEDSCKEGTCKDIVLRELDIDAAIARHP